MNRSLAHHILDAARAGRNVDPTTITDALHETGDLPLRPHCLQRESELYAGMDETGRYAAESARAPALLPGQGA